jgi:hypothetical protein
LEAFGLDHRNPPPTFYALAYVVIAGILLFGALSHRAYDDPFITYRYARNVARGIGFVYNPGEHVLSTTTPLFTLMLAGVYWLWERLPLQTLVSANNLLPQAANLIGALSLAWGGWSLWILGRLWKAWPVSWLGLLVYPTFPLLLSTLGSETPLTLALCLAAFPSFVRGKYSLSAFYVALATLARPDAILVAGILGVEFVIQQRPGFSRVAFQRLVTQIPWKSIAIFAGVLLPWMAFASWYFGSPLPATLTAKQSQGAMQISQAFAPGLATIAGGLWNTWTFRVESLLALLGLFAAFGAYRKSLFFLAWPVIYFISYSLLGVSRYFWYYAPLVPGFLTAAGLGLAGIFHVLDWVAERLGRLFSQNRRSPNQELPREDAPKTTPSFIATSSLFLTAGVCTLLAWGQVSSLWAGAQRNDPRYTIYRTAGKWLAQNTLPGQRIGALEIGIVGYYAKRPMIDFAGLVQPLVVAQFSSTTTYQDSTLWAFSHYQPEILLLHDGFLSESQLSIIETNCQVAHRFKANDHSFYSDFLVYSCQYP